MMPLAMNLSVIIPMLPYLSSYKMLAFLFTVRLTSASLITLAFIRFLSLPRISTQLLLSSILLKAKLEFLLREHTRNSCLLVNQSLMNKARVLTSVKIKRKTFKNRL